MASDNSKLQTQLPEILYEDPESGGSPFPFIQTKKEIPMPSVLFIFEYKDTGEFEPGPKGEEIPIVDQIPHKFVDMEILKEKLEIDVFDKVRVALGMLPLKQASELGQEKLSRALDKAEKFRQDKLNEKK